MWLGLQIYAEPDPAGDDGFAHVKAEAQRAERSGFELVSLVEHHQGQYGEFSSPLTWLAAIAACTKRIRLATGVLLLPLYNPVLLAEQVHTVDRISGGRLSVGVGLGYRDADFEAAGVDPKTRVSRFIKGVDVLRRGGDPHRPDAVQVAPRPHQPTIPLYGGGMVPASVRRIARLCDAWLASASMPPANFAELAELHRREARAAGRGHAIILNRNAWYAPSREQAEHEYREVYQARVRSERQGLHAGALPTPVWEVWKASCLLGNAQDWLTQLRPYLRVADLAGLIVRLRTPWGPPSELVQERIEQVGHELGPVLADPS